MWEVWYKLNETAGVLLKALPQGFHNQESAKRAARALQATAVYANTTMAVRDPSTGRFYKVR